MLALTGPAPAAVRALAFKAAGNLARDQNDFGAAIEFHRRAQALFAEAGDGAGLAAVLNNLGAVELDLGHGPAAMAHFEPSLERFTVPGSLAFTAPPGEFAAPDSAVLLCIADAVRHHRPVSIRYTAADGRRSERTLHPYGLVAHSGR